MSRAAKIILGIGAVLAAVVGFASFVFVALMRHGYGNGPAKLDVYPDIVLPALAALGTIGLFAIYAWVVDTLIKRDKEQSQ